MKNALILLALVAASINASAQTTIIDIVTPADWKETTMSIANSKDLPSKKTFKTYEEAARELAVVMSTLQQEGSELGDLSSLQVMHGDKAYIHYQYIMRPARSPMQGQMRQGGGRPAGEQSAGDGTGGGMRQRPAPQTQPAPATPGQPK